MLIEIFASAVTCILGIDCDLSATLKSKIEAIPNVKSTEVVQDYSLTERYHARITLRSGDTFDLIYIGNEHLLETEYFWIRQINGYQYDYVYCEKSTSPNQAGKIRHGHFSLGSRGSFQHKFPFLIRNIKDLVQNFEAIKIEYFRTSVEPKFLYDKLSDGNEIYAMLLKVRDKNPLGPYIFLLGEPYKNAWKFKNGACRYEH